MAEVNSYNVPKWAGIPPSGYHLDVMKEGKFFQKLMIDEKNHYLFGRNQTMTDFCIDHASCSRVHAALVYHKNLERFFLVDLGSTHGSFIGSVRIEEHKPTPLCIDSSFHFGASTRTYTLREKPKQSETINEDALMSLLEHENEVDHLTEYNTTQNRRVSMLGVSETDNIKAPITRKRKSVQFKPDDEIINPEDVDPTVGRFRNLVQTSIVPTGNKRSKVDHSSNSSLYSSLFNNSSLRINTKNSPSSTGSLAQSLLQKNSLAIHLSNPAPEIEEPIDENSPSQPAAHSQYLPQEMVENVSSLYEEEELDEGQKKKYAKEAWPGHEKTTTLTNF